MRYFIAFLVTIGLIILIIVLLLTGGNEPVTPRVTKAITDYASSDAQVSVLIDGPINAVSLHEQVRITVDRNNVMYEHLKGYDGEVVDSHIFANTQSAYDNFLHALFHAGFNKRDTARALEDERGYCPTDNRYIFELTENGEQLQRSWATDCGSPRTYLGSLNLTLTLFKAQVPGYQTLTQGIPL